MSDTTFRHWFVVERGIALLLLVLGFRSFVGGGFLGAAVAALLLVPVGIALYLSAPRRQ